MMVRKSKLSHEPFRVLTIIGQTRLRKRNRSVCCENRHTGQKKRGRQEGNATTPMNSHDGEASLTTQSQRIPGGNSSSRQAIDASAYTRDTPSNTREETAVNQSLHPGFTAPVHVMPPPASLPVPDPAVSSQRAETRPTLHPQRYTDYPSASPMSSSGRIEGATSGIADRQICTLPPLQEITGQSAEGRHTPARFPTPCLTAMDRRGQDVHNLHLQWQPDAELVRRQETAAEAACFRPSPNTNIPMHANLTRAGETLVQQRPTDYLESYGQDYLPANQGYVAIGASAPAWNDTSYELQSEEFDPEFWNTIFLL